jgi:hypothetical protein
MLKYTNAVTKNTITRPVSVAYDCNTNYLGDEDRRIAVQS